MLSEEWECFVKSNDEFIEGLQLLYKKWDIGYLRKILTLCYVEPEVAEEGDRDIGGEGMNNDEHMVQYDEQKVVVGGRRRQAIDGIYNGLTLGYVKSNNEFTEGLQLLYKERDIGYLREILTPCYVEPEVADEGDRDIGWEGMNNDEQIVQNGEQKVVVGG